MPERGFGTRGDMTVLVPEDKAAELGVRAAISLEEVDEVLAVLAVITCGCPPTGPGGSRTARRR